MSRLGMNTPSWRRPSRSHSTAKHTVTTRVAVFVTFFRGKKKGPDFATILARFNKNLTANHGIVGVVVPLTNLDN